MRFGICCILILISIFIMYNCDKCSHVSASWKQSIKHRKIHRALTKRFFCGYNGCNDSFKKEICLRMHLIRLHNVSIKTENVEEDVRLSNQDAHFTCNISTCAKIYNAKSKYVKHLKSHILQGSCVNCPYSECHKAYNNITSFTGHISKFHRKSVLVPSYRPFSP